MGSPALGFDGHMMIVVDWTPCGCKPRSVPRWMVPLTDVDGEVFAVCPRCLAAWQPMDKTRCAITCKPCPDVDRLVTDGACPACPHYRKRYPDGRQWNEPAMTREAFHG